MTNFNITSSSAFYGSMLRQSGILSAENDGQNVGYKPPYDRGFSFRMGPKEFGPIIEKTTTAKVFVDGVHVANIKPGGPPFVEDVKDLESMAIEVVGRPKVYPVDAAVFLRCRILTISLNLPPDGYASKPTGRVAAIVEYEYPRQ